MSGSMPKRITKSDAIKSIKDTDELEIIFEEIMRSESQSLKQSKLNRFISETQRQIKEDRDVRLFAVKVK
jgi:hypothetical protein